MVAPIKRYGIVVGVDGSPASNFAVCWAARDAAMRHIPLTLVHMVNAGTMWPQGPMSPDAGAWRGGAGPPALRQAVQAAEDAMEAFRGIEISTGLSHSPPVPTLAEMSEQA